MEWLDGHGARRLGHAYRSCLRTYWPCVQVDQPLHRLHVGHGEAGPRQLQEHQELRRARH
eukprot:1820209-Pyramimonas_sp.AAC.1